MAVYLLHFSVPLGNSTPHGAAQHYIGWAAHVEERIAYHRSGNGAAITKAAVAAGAELILARVWPSGDKALERRLKALKNAPRLCPLCTSNPRPAEYSEAKIEVSDCPF